MTILILDNYDSFTFNLYQRFGEIDPTLDVRVVRNDKIDLDAIAAVGADRIVISPGPKTPAEAGLSTAVVARFGGEVPLLGVCLGHQCLSAAFGGKVEPAVRLMHGKTSAVEHDGSGLFAGLESPLTATRYHSLAVPPDAVPAGFVVNAWVDDPATGTQEVMGIRHTEKPIHGLQFHPESFLTDRGHDMLRNFLAAA